MKASFAARVCDSAFSRSISIAVSCLLSGALACTLGAAGCNNDATAQPPAMMMPTDPGPTTLPTPYTPAYPPAAPQVLQGTGGVLPTPRVIRSPAQTWLAQEPS